MDKHYIAVGNGRWYRAETKEAAIEKYRAQMPAGDYEREIGIYAVPPRTQISDMGTFVFFPPEGKTWDDLTIEEQREYRQDDLIETLKVTSKRQELINRLFKSIRPHMYKEVLEEMCYVMSLDALEDFVWVYE